MFVCFFLVLVVLFFLVLFFWFWLFCFFLVSFFLVLVVLFFLVLFFFGFGCFVFFGFCFFGFVVFLLGGLGSVRVGGGGHFPYANSFPNACMPEFRVKQHRKIAFWKKNPRPTIVKQRRKTLVLGSRYLYSHNEGAFFCMPRCATKSNQRFYPHIANRSHQTALLL